MGLFCSYRNVFRAFISFLAGVIMIYGIARAPWSMMSRAVASDRPCSVGERDQGDTGTHKSHHKSHHKSNEECSAHKPAQRPLHTMEGVEVFFYSRDDQPHSSVSLGSVAIHHGGQIHLSGTIHWQGRWTSPEVNVPKSLQPDRQKNLQPGKQKNLQPSKQKNSQLDIPMNSQNSEATSWILPSLLTEAPDRNFRVEFKAEEISLQLQSLAQSRERGSARPGNEPQGTFPFPWPGEKREVSYISILGGLRAHMGTTSITARELHYDSKKLQLYMPGSVELALEGHKLSLSQGVFLQPRHAYRWISMMRLLWSSQ